MKTLLLTFILVCTCLLAYANDTLKTRQANQWLQNAPLQFTENKGQIKDAQILYTVKAKGLQIALSKNQIQYTWTKITYKPKKESKSKHDLQREMPEIEEYKTHSIQMQLLNTNPNVQVIAQDQALEIQNYYNIPSVPEGITNVKSYTKIIYKEIYPKIDLIIYTSPLTPGGGTKDISPTGGKGKNSPFGGRGALKYDFLVHPGGNPKNIQIQYSGQDTLYLDKQGNLTLKHALGELTEAAPYTYQGDTQIPCQYQLTKAPPLGAGGLTGGLAFISFALGDYNPYLPLTIDPDLIWATYYGGSGEDRGNSVAVDGLGNVYLAGETASTTAIATSGGFQNTYGGGLDAFVVKFDASGARLWATYYGGSFDDEGNSVALDGSGNVYLAGQTGSITAIASGGFQNTYGGDEYEAFLVKFDASGARLWATYYGGMGYDLGLSVAVDGLGNVYLAGWASYTDSPTAIASGGFQNTYGGGGDAFVVKFDASGVRIWATYYGGTGFDSGNSVAVDGSGNVYLAGETESTTAIASSGGFQNTYGGAFVVKFDASGARLWATYYGGDASGRSVAVDGLGNVYLAGFTRSTTAIASSGFQNTYGGGSTFGDAFVVKFDASGARLWATYYGGTGDDTGNSVSVDGLGNVYLAGETRSNTAIASNGFQNTYGGGRDAFVVKFNASGARGWATYYGGTGDDYGNSVSVDGLGNVYLSGFTESTSAIAASGFQNTYGGGSYDAFLAKLCSVNYNPIVSIQSSDADLKLCKGESLTLTAQVQDNTDSPQRVWRRNGLFISNDNAVSSTTFNDGDLISLELVYAGYDAACIKNNIATVQLTIIDYVTPTVAVSVENGVICSANPVTLNANTTNVGATSTYNWYRKPNGSANFILLASTTVPTYLVASGLLKNGDKIKIDVIFSTTEVPCYTTPSNTISSAEFAVSVTPTLTAAIDISADISNGQAICNGDTLTFYATNIFNPGDIPRFVWSTNDVIRDTTDIPQFTTNQFISNKPNNKVSVTLLSSYPCLSNTSLPFSDFELAVQSNIQPKVTIQALSGTQICTNEVASFKANPTGGGVEPLYQWYINSTPQGILTVENIFNTIGLQNTDTVSVKMVSSLTCASTPTVNSTNQIVMQVTLAPSVEITSNLGNTVCENNDVVFTAIFQNEGANPTFQWRKNGLVIVGATGQSYTLNNASPDDDESNIDVQMTTSINCKQPKITSNPINLQVENTIIPSVKIKSRQDNILCFDSEIVFEITEIYPFDPNAVFEWILNGSPVPNSNTPIFNAGILQGTVSIQVKFTTTFGCAEPKFALSAPQTFTVEILAAPTELKATTGNGLKVNLTWKDNSTRESGFIIERSEDNNQFFVPRAYLFANQTDYIDQFGLRPLTTYFYRIRAVVDDFNDCLSEYSNESGAATGISDIITNLDELNENTLTVFPNPSTNGVFNLRYLGNATEMDIEVRNLVGQSLLKQSTQFKINEATPLDLSRLANGMYWLFVRKGNKQMVVKILRE